MTKSGDLDGENPFQRAPKASKTMNKYPACKLLNAPLISRDFNPGNVDGRRLNALNTAPSLLSLSKGAKVKIQQIFRIPFCKMLKTADTLWKYDQKAFI